MAKTPRKWTGARSPSGLKRVRSSARRHAVLEPRRSAAKTLVKTALAAVVTPDPGTDASVALAEAMSALDRAAKVGAIHPNQAARRKSRLAIKVYDTLAGVGGAAGPTAKTVSKAQAQKAARARIAAGRADKAKGAQTAAGKARAALGRTSRGETPDSTSAQATGRTGTTQRTAARAGAKTPAAKAPAAKAPADKATASRTTAAKPTAKPAAASTAKGAAKAAAKPATKPVAKSSSKPATSKAKAAK